MRNCAKIIESPKKMKNKYKPEAVSPKPNVAQTSGEVSHALISSTHVYTRTRPSSMTAMMPLSTDLKVLSHRMRA
jgi:hypothetical protein